MGGNLMKYLNRHQTQQQDKQFKRRQSCKNYRVVASNTSCYNEKLEREYAQISDGEKAILRYYKMQHHS